MQLDQPLNNADILIFDDTRKNFIEQGYKNPILLIHLQSQSVTDIALTMRFKQIQVHFQEGLLDPDTTIISIWPSFRLGAGPTEALWQVSSRSNCGVTHFIMGQDPAGVKHPENKRIDCYNPDHGFDLANTSSAEVYGFNLGFAATTVNYTVTVASYGGGNKFHIIRIAKSFIQGTVFRCQNQFSAFD